MKNIRVIYFEDDMEKFRITEDILQELQIQLIRVPRNEESLSQLNTLDPDVVLVEQRHSTKEYYQLLFKMDVLNKLSRIPKIVITYQDQTYDLLYSPKNPLWDWIGYPFGAQEFLARVMYLLEKVKANASRE